MNEQMKIQIILEVILAGSYLDFNYIKQRQLL